jgi:hypothetical protein
MKYIIPENKLDKIIFKYLDIILKRLVKREDWEGIVFSYPDEEHGILAYFSDDGTLYIYHRLTDEISKTFKLNESDSKLIIGRWVSDRYQLEVTNTDPSNYEDVNLLAIDTN